MQVLTAHDARLMMRTKGVSNFTTRKYFSEQIDRRVKMSATHGKTFCTFHIPKFVFGKPLYNSDNVRESVAHGLLIRGFKVKPLENNSLYIAW